jgi:hypothetical protein
LPLFAFSQIEVPWPLGPPDGRYLVRAENAPPQAPPTHVLLFATLGAARRGRLTRRNRTAAPDPEPVPVATGRATVIATAAPFVDAAAAARWLAAAGEAELAEHLLVLARTLHAYRVVTADPYSEPLDRERLLVARVGFGEGEQVANGRWSQARELLGSELAADGRLASRLAQLRELRSAVDHAAAGAHSRELTESELEAVSSTLARLEAVLRARAASLT